MYRESRRSLLAEERADRKTLALLASLAEFALLLAVRKSALQSFVIWLGLIHGSDSLPISRSNQG